IVKRPPLINRGDHVTILVEIAGIQVRAEGIALKSGSRGDRMLVQNIRSKQTLQSIVQDAHTVSIAVGGV
ncbi:MAG: flagellar basal body P-ring formation chaperone FlgA, partial [Ghiorsea sp.]|nr:flagellar basal body P-ring formation chaperone FlgA [Ghiorsea sp.]